MKSIVTVLTPAESYDLTTVEIAREELGITDTSQDAKLQRWISDASAQISSYLNRVLALEEVEEVFQPSLYFDSTQIDLARPLPVTRFPVTEIESIQWGTADPIDPSTYRLDAEAGMVYRAQDTLGYDSWWWHGYGGWHGTPMIVRYWGGYSLLDKLPADIGMACLLLLRYRNSGASRDPNVSMERVFEVQELRYFDPQRAAASTNTFSVPADVAAILRPYRREIS